MLALTSHTQFGAQKFGFLEHVYIGVPVELSIAKLKFLSHSEHANVLVADRKQLVQYYIGQLMQLYTVV